MSEYLHHEQGYTVYIYYLSLISLSPTHLFCQFNDNGLVFCHMKIHANHVSNQLHIYMYIYIMNKSKITLN